MEYSIRLIMVLSGSVTFLTWEIMNRLLGNKMKARGKRNLFLFSFIYFRLRIIKAISWIFTTR